MLYITTRDMHDVHTENKTLISDVAADGGLYLPRSMHYFSGSEIAEFKNAPFNEIFATVLNHFFSDQLTRQDIDLFIGKNPVKILPVGRKILVAQAWHNPARAYKYLENNIYKKLCKGAVADTPTEWLKIAVRISLIFSTYGELLRSGQVSSTQPLDVAVDADNFTSTVAAFYAKQIGLPIGRLICGCDETGALWDFIHLGEVSTGSAPDALLRMLERLIHARFGADEVEKFLQVCQKRGTYRIPQETENDLPESIFCAVVGKERISAVINSVYRTDDFFMDIGAARSFGAVQDYRAKTGNSNPTLLLSDCHPLQESDLIMNATGLSQNAFYDKCRII